MKRKLVALAILSMAVSTQSFSMEIVKGKLISHKESFTGPVLKASIKDMTSAEMKTNKFLSLKRNPAHGPIQTVINWHFIRAKINGFTPLSHSVLPGVPYAISGSTYVTMQNFTDAVQTYSIDRAVCTDTENPVSGYPMPACAVFTDTVSLDPYGSVTLSQMPRMEYTYNKQGFYTYSVNLAVVNLTTGEAFETNDLDGVCVGEEGSCSTLSPITPVSPTKK